MSALSRGIVWCKICGHSRRVDLMSYIRYNVFPRCCNVTTTIDSPEEREVFRKELDREQRQYYLR